MALTVPDIGERALLDMMLSDASPAAQELKLYSAVSPAIGESSVAGDFTAATFTGYAKKAMARATWGAAATSGATSKTYPLQSWSPLSSQTILGYYITEATDADLLWAEAYASSRALVSGDTLNQTVIIEAA